MVTVESEVNEVNEECRHDFTRSMKRTSADRLRGESLISSRIDMSDGAGDFVSAFLTASFSSEAIKSHAISFCFSSCTVCCKEPHSAHEA